MEREKVNVPEKNTLNSKKFNIKKDFLETANFYKKNYNTRTNSKPFKKFRYYQTFLVSFIGTFQFKNICLA